MLRNLRSYGSIRAAEPDNPDSMRVTAVISTGDVARDGAIIDPAGWDFTNYLKNPIVLYAHDDGVMGAGAMPVARTVEGPTLDGDQLIATAEFDSEDPVALRVLGKIRRGFLNGTSVRWNPFETEEREVEDPERHATRKVLVFKRQELLEWSIVPIPADPGATIMRSDGTAIAIEDFQQKPSEQPLEEQAPPTRNALLDDIDYVTRELDKYGLDDFAKRLQAPDRELVRELQSQLAHILRPIQGAKTLSHIETRLDDYERRLAEAPGPADAFVKVLARTTGRSEQTIREEYGL